LPRQPTGTDLDQWSARFEARHHLPTLVRRLILATATPNSLRMAAAEAVSEPGFDGILELDAPAGPFMPQGRSVWELGAGNDPARKAASDYSTRTAQTPPDERSLTTFVFVTSRSWPGARAWAAERAGGEDGWSNVIALDAEDLATWVSTCPGVSAWLSTEYLGQPLQGITPLRGWFSEWAGSTDPTIPAALLMAGRKQAAVRLWEDLTGAAATSQVIAARSRDEAVAFVAAVLLIPPAADAEPGGDNANDDTPPPDRSRHAEPPVTAGEVLLERALVVHDLAGWTASSVHEQPTVIICLLDDINPEAALRAGHQVILVEAGGTSDRLLPPISRSEARAIWEQQGLDFRQADELARAARRSLTSLRRRMARTRRLQHPAWSQGDNGTLLAPLLLAGAWRDDVPGDQRVVEALLAGAPWPSVARRLAAIGTSEDPPLRERAHMWEFLDQVDAWDALSSALTAHDLDLYEQLTATVLTEPDPAATMTEAERKKQFLTFDSQHRRDHSPVLRRGLAETAALLGAVVGDRELPGGQTGQTRASVLIRTLLADADSSRWHLLADLLPVLAEAAPDRFLDAVEASLNNPGQPLMALFDEHDTGLGLSVGSNHSALLWALETLAWSPQHLTRVAVVLARLDEADPGGRLSNRPEASLAATLHLIFPQSPVDTALRLRVVDTVRRHAPQSGWKLLSTLVSTVNRGMILRTGPTWRDWPREPVPVTYADVGESILGLTERIVADAGADAQRWAAAVALIDDVPPAGRLLMLEAADAQWEQIDIDGRRRIVDELTELVSKHQQFRDAVWALDDAGLEQLQAWLDAHPVPGLQRADSALFTWWPRGIGRPDDESAQAQLVQDRAQAVARALDEGLEGVARLARAAELPETVGQALASHTADLDQAVLDLLGGEDGALHRLAHGVATARQDDPAWLAAQVAARPGQAVDLLLTARMSRDVLDLVDSGPEATSAAYWARVKPWAVPEDLVIECAEALLAHDRPFSAVWLLAHAGKTEQRPQDVIARALTAPTQGTQEPVTDAPTIEHAVGVLLDALAGAGADDEQVAGLEWFYFPLLQHQRDPHALYRRLARDPDFFTDVVSVLYKPDPATEAGSDSQQAAPAAQPDIEPAAELDASSQVPFDVAYGLLHDWRLPLPGTGMVGEAGRSPAQTWVDRARAHLAARGRSKIASVVIGEALSGPQTDPDGLWPSGAIRDVLEQEQDRRLEEGLMLGRMNQRGVTVRGPYDGGEQERRLAEQYRTWASQVRNDSPRAGVVLDELARSYDADARREDHDADEQAGR
jgi:hypothetical protein